MYKHAFLIVYPSGGYGTFLDWCINRFSGQLNDSSLPFLNTGSAHKWVGTATGDVTNRPSETIEWFLQKDEDFFTLRTHTNCLTVVDQKKFNQTFLSFSSNFRKIIIINNNVKYHLLILHNALTKAKPATYESLSEDIIVQYRNQFDAEEFVPKWQLREMMSFWHEKWHCYLRDIYQPINHSNIVNININDLLVDFENCIINLLTDLEVPIIHQNRLTEVKESWLSLQKFKNIDQQCSEIVDAVVNNRYLDFGDISLHLLDEAFIQYKLRVDHNLDLLCTGLDDFPKTSQDLKKLLIPYVDKSTKNTV